ncbi:MAG: LamB/YcsF family protein [Tindallia sp. MSAO_Bac2]|nr:MAG: LamB/YcsF family protein [Tindallia sp. MSAO_Bac2]
MTLLKVDLNSDIGESFGAYTMGLDEEVMKYVTSANIACGWHAGDPMVMAKTVETAVKEGVSMGAHPGYPDLMGFGRREMKITPQEAKAYTIYQLGALDAFVRAAGAKLRHVKAHGAFYNMAAKDEKLAMAIAEGVKAVNPDLVLMGLANSQLVKAGEAVGLKSVHEVFADRAYNPDGTLVARSQEGAMIKDADIAIGRVIRMVKEGKVEAITGEDIAIQADSICVHGDSPQALEFVQKIRKALQDENIEIMPI